VFHVQLGVSRLQVDYFHSSILYIPSHFVSCQILLPDVCSCHSGEESLCWYASVGVLFVSNVLSF